MAGRVPAIFALGYLYLKLTGFPLRGDDGGARDGMQKSCFVIVTAVLMIANSTFAADIPIPPPPAHATSKTAPSKILPVQANQPHCSRWTDECTSCTRGADGETPACSNIGIACQPKSIRCLSGDLPQSEPPK
jgi:hypothetical protein